MSVVDELREAIGKKPLPVSFKKARAAARKALLTAGFDDAGHHALNGAIRCAAVCMLLINGEPTLDTGSEMWVYEQKELDAIGLKRDAFPTVNLTLDPEDRRVAEQVLFDTGCDVGLDGQTSSRVTKRPPNPTNNN
jgi:hypothetical protein